MIALIVASHGDYSKELVNSAEMIFGHKDNVGVVTFHPGEGSEDLIKKYNNILAGLDNTDGVLFLVDLFGGSPFNAASILALQNKNMEIVAGVNLPMLLEVFAACDISTLPQLVDTALSAGKNSIKLLNKNNNDSEEDDF